MNKALIITNPGMIDPLAFELMGASSKRGDDKTIGMFGSGLKYAIAGLLRRGIDFQVWCGNEVLEITTEKVVMRGKEYDRILFNGKQSSLTTDMGPNWEKWMLIREIYANAIDEGGEMAVTEDYAQFIGENKTTFIFPDSEQMQDVLSDQDILFCRGRDIVYEDPTIRIYEELGDGGYYVKGILVGRMKPGFGYMLIDPYKINEERQLRDTFSDNMRTVAAIIKITDKRMVKRLCARIRQDNSLEHDLFRYGYVGMGAKASSAWEDVVIFKVASADFATEWNHIVVSDDLYTSLDNIQKWEDLRWKKAGTSEQNDKLKRAVEIVRNAVPGELPACEWSFGTSISRNIATGTEKDMAYLNISFAQETEYRLAAEIANFMGHDSFVTKLLEAHFKQS